MHVRYDRDKGVLQFDQRSAIESLARKLGLDDDRRSRTLPISSEEKLEKLDAPEKASYVKDFLSIVGSCLHISQVSRPDTAYAVGVLCRHAATPGEQHMNAARSLVSYLYSSRHWCIQYTKSDTDGNNPHIEERSWHPHQATIEERLIPGTPEDVSNVPHTFMDADLGGDKVTRKSTSGLVIMMNRGPIAWNSRLQKLCAQSSAEAEINAVVDGVKEALHMRLLCEESGIRSPDRPITVWEDNQACIQLGHKLRGANSAKHFELRLRFLNEQIWEDNIEFAKIDTKKQLADGFTKPLKLAAFREFRSQLMVNPKSD
jgi:hypothetical protein